MAQDWSQLSLGIGRLNGGGESTRNTEARALDRAPGEHPRAQPGILGRGQSPPSIRGASDARFWIWTSETNAVAMTVITDSWHREVKKRRRELRDKVMDALPPPNAGF